uniref:Globin family profile domain-containing protein n=1 Tax=Ditylum brightwellii TaxID=49249 RepID=A0A7S2EGC6_9STRA|mmetsp:Transcript_28251/g.42009  ORF Transcript_28251/g.42009 Transcript_28251/m.42009 type:complete len:418 (+) Transcript_28251:86-1339(+)
MSEGKTATLLERIGGEPALEAAVDEFYKRLVADNTLKQFFEGISIENLKEHQRKFLRLAFTKIPESIDVEQFMLEKHQRLFCMGLNEKHFDSVATHFVETLQHLGVPKNLIDEAVGIIGPLRPIFEQGAAKAKEAEKDEEKKSEEFLLHRLGGDDALEAAVDEFYDRLLADTSLAQFFDGIAMDNLKDHQRKFLRLAFTKIPESVDVEKLLMDKHALLFEMGLNATHFDSVAGHFVGTLQHLGVAQELIDEAVGIVAPLRGIFEKGAEKAKWDDKKDDYLLTKIGGDAALTAAVDEFYNRLLADKSLSKFFEGIRLDTLKGHQRKFMRMAFTKIPDDIDVEQMMFKKHFHLFQKGLDETHFDSVATHFVETLQHLGVAQELIDEAVGIIAPLRGVFVKGGESKKRRMSRIDSRSQVS